MSEAVSRCPDCDCPNQACYCVARGRYEGAERRMREASSEAARYRALFQAAASIIAHNRAKLAKPRGPDEARVFAYLDEGGACALGSFWSGKTDGWIQPDMFDGALTRTEGAGS